MIESFYVHNMSDWHPDLNNTNSSEISKVQ